MVWSYLSLAVRSRVALLLLFARADRSKELEILVLRHRLALWRRRSGRPRIERSDRALLAPLSRALPGRRGATFSVSPGDGAALAPPAGYATVDVSDVLPARVDRLGRDVL